MKTEEKGKVVAIVWGTYLTVLSSKDDLNKIFGKELNQFRPQTAATTLTFSSVLILFLLLKQPNRAGQNDVIQCYFSHNHVVSVSNVASFSRVYTISSYPQNYK